MFLQCVVSSQTRSQVFDKQYTIECSAFDLQLDTALEREEIINELFYILSNKETVIALTTNCDNIGLFHDEVGQSL